MQTNKLALSDRSTTGSSTRRSRSIPFAISIDCSLRAWLNAETRCGYCRPNRVRSSTSVTNPGATRTTCTATSLSGGLEVGGSGLSAVLRDYARFGLLLLLDHSGLDEYDFLAELAKAVHNFYSAPAG